MTEAEIKEVLKGVKYPGFSRDIVSFGLVRSVLVEPGRCEVRLSILSDNQDVVRQIVADATRDGGFPPLFIDPIDFVALYQQRVAQGEADIARAN